MDSVFLKELDMDKLIDTRIDGGIETYSYTGHQKTYISLHENGYGTHFSVSSSGIYRIFMENVGSTSITILGSYAFDPSQNINSNQ